MEIDKYVEGARRTAIYPERGKLGGLLYAAIGLGGESGELLNKVKKILRDNSGNYPLEIRLGLAAELGDILWYLVAVADEIGVSLENIAQDNLRKLAMRQLNGKIGGSGDNR